MIEIKVDATAVLAKFSPSGIPEAVRRALRRVLPDLTRRLGAQVEANLNTGLKSRNRLQVNKELVENPTQVTGRVRTVSTSDPTFLPQILETGAVAHAIEARNAQALYFYWDRIGANVAFKRVWHPGFPGIHYMENAFTAMEDEIKASVEQAVRAAVMGPG